MADRNLPRIIARRFRVAARVMGWDIAGPRWSVVDGANVSKFPHYSLQKHGRANKYEINATVNDKGGETMIRGVIGGDEILEWLDGILHGADHFNPDIVRQAWALTNEEIKVP